MNFLKKAKSLILIHSNMGHVTHVPPEGVNIMLTPQFYVIKKKEIPVKYAYQAKRIAPSLFEGLLEDANYKYFVTKEEDAWLFIAYNEKKLKSFLEQVGISPDQVSKVYFAQQAAEQFTAPVLLGEKEALVNIEGTMTVIPQSVLTIDEKTMQIGANLTPEKGVSLEGSSQSFVTSNEAYTLAAIFLLFAGIYFVEGSRYGGESEAEAAEVQALLEEHPSLQSSYTRESIAKKYKTIDKKERKKRDTIKALSHMIFKGSTLNTLSINDTKFQAQFSCRDANVAKKLKELAKKEKFNTSKISNSNDIKIEGTL